MSERRKRAIAITLTLAVVAAVLLALLGVWENRHSLFPDDTPDGWGADLEHNGKQYVLNPDVETILIMGLDKVSDEIANDSYNNNQQADFLILFILDNAKKTCTALHINRDTIVEMNVLGVAGEKVGTVNKQLALSHTYGNGKIVSCRNTADAVSNLLYNARIDHYLSVTMDSVAVFNDFVGGVELEILDDFSGVDPSMVQGQTMTLTGEQALKYVRSRKDMDDSTNNRRMERQRQYMEALRTKAESVEQSNPQFAAEAAKKMSDYLVSNCSITLLQSLYEKVSDYQYTGMLTMEGEHRLGQFVEFYPNEVALKEQAIALFYKEK